MAAREPMKQGIVAILGTDCDKAAVSIRRTLSADLSSKKWLLKNGGLITSEESVEEESEQDDAWKRIQSREAEMDANWGAILAGNKENKPAYVHPLVQRSAAALTERTLQICTESLGSETGSVKSVSLSSEILNDGSRDGEERQGHVVLVEECDKVVKYKNCPAPPLPPPLSSASRGGGDGASFYMNTRRKNGRLVLEAVAVSPRKVYFHAEREDGRLVLTPVDPLHGRNREMVEKKVEEFEEVFDTMEEVAEKKAYDSEDGDSYDEEEVEDEEAISKSITLNWQKHSLSLPPRPPPVARLIPPPPASTASNTHDYFRQGRRSMAQNQEMAAMEGNRAEYSPAKGCKQEPKRAYLVWEPRCIATS